MSALSPARRREITLDNWRVHPNSPWSFQNVAEFVPTARIAEPLGGEPPVTTPGLIARLQVAGDGGRVSLSDHLAATHADAFVMLRNGEFLDEWHAPHVEPARPHIIFSISKSVTGLLAGIAAGDGSLDPDRPVLDYVPEAAGSTYATATVRHLLDMTVDLDFEENYLDQDGAFNRYRRATLWNPQRPGAAPESLLEFLVTLRGKGAGHGRTFFYTSPNSDMLGIVVERATGQRLADFMATRLWRPMGARGPAEITVDRVGWARAAGGMSVALRDLARMGALVLADGRAPDGTQVVPSRWIADMRDNGDRQAWIDGNFYNSTPDGRYRSCWYEVGDARRSFYAVGIHEQWLWCDRTSGLVLAKFSSRPEPSDEARSIAEIATLSEIARQI
ncbi:MAG: serine hydrolase [Rhizobiaceae bacterium]|nr:serine hydrolase [Rhizobiaceae bacterium]